MALKEDNYWGRNRTPSTQAQITPSSQGRSIDEIIAASRNGHPPTALEVQNALKQLADQAKRNYETTGSRKLSAEQAAQNKALLYEIMPNATKPDLYNNPADAFKPVSAPVNNYKGPSVSETLFGKSGGVTKGVGDIASGIGGIGALIADEANAAEEAKANSPEALYNRLRQEAGNYTYNGPSVKDMVGKEFDPQFALLDQLGKQAGTKYAGNKADITQMYNQLVNEAGASRTADKQMFDQAGNKIGQNYAGATKNLTDSSSAYSAAMAKELAALGVKEGLGTIAGDVGKNLQDNVGRLNQQGAVSKDLMTNLGANEFAFDTRNIDTTRQAGVNTQTEFLKNYMDQMSGLDNQRLQLTGQRGQAENNYGMQIQDLLQKGQASFQDNILNQFKSIQGANQQQTDNLYKQAGLDLDQQKFAFQQQQAMQKQDSSTQLNPYDSLSKRALAQYGDPVKARQAVDEILAAYQNNPNPQSIGDFLNSVDQDALRSNPEMTSLIYDFISQVIGSKR